MLKEPVPGQPLTATWGRDIVREINRIRITSANGLRMTQGPNGTTLSFSGARGGSGAGTSASGDHPFKLFIHSTVANNVRSHWATVMCNDGIVQVDDETADCHATAVPGLQPGWRYVAAGYDQSGDEIRYSLESLLSASIPSKDVFALVYRNSENSDSLSFVIEFDGVWSSYIPEDRRVLRAYIGTIVREETDDHIVSFSVSNQSLRSAIVASDTGESESSLPFPFQLKADNSTDQGGHPTSTVICYFPQVYIDGELAVIDNDEYYETGSGWYIPVFQTSHTGDSYFISCYLKKEGLRDHSPHILVSTYEDGDGIPSGYDEEILRVGEILVVEGLWTITQQYILGAQLLYDPVDGVRITGIEDHRTVTGPSAVGIVGVSSITGTSGPSGTITGVGLVIKDGIGSDKVVVDETPGSQTFLDAELVNIWTAITGITPGPPGPPGGVWIPEISNDGVLSWSFSSGSTGTAPSDINIKGGYYYPYIDEEEGTLCWDYETGPTPTAIQSMEIKGGFYRPSLATDGTITWSYTGNTGSTADVESTEFVQMVSAFAEDKSYMMRFLSDLYSTPPSPVTGGTGPATGGTFKFETAPTGIKPDVLSTGATGATGISDKFCRADHQHPIAADNGRYTSIPIASTGTSGPTDTSPPSNDIEWTMNGTNGSVFYVLSYIGQEGSSGAIHNRVLYLRKITIDQFGRVRKIEKCDKKFSVLAP